MNPVSCQEKQNETLVENALDMLLLKTSKIRNIILIVYFALFFLFSLLSTHNCMYVSK